MKSIVSIEQAIGGDGAKLKAGLEIDGSNLVADIQVSMPLEKVLNPVNAVIDSIIDKVEALIPGDQTALAAALKADAHAQLVKLLSETPA